MLCGAAQRAKTHGTHGSSLGRSSAHLARAGVLRSCCTTDLDRTFDDHNPSGDAFGDAVGVRDELGDVAGDAVGATVGDVVASAGHGRRHRKVDGTLNTESVHAPVSSDNFESEFRFWLYRLERYAQALSARNRSI